MPKAYGATLIIMVKAPVAGRVKTRLAADIGTARATAFYRRAVATIVRRFGTDIRWRTVLAIAPDAAVGDAAWQQRVSGLQRVAQGGGGLGDRMVRAFKTVRPGPVVMIGSDAIAIQPTDIAAAFASLKTNDAVFGPAPDGGYWLIGAAPSVDVARMLAGVRWSTEHTLADTAANLSNARIAMLRPLRDVDTGAEFATEHRAIGRLLLPR